MKNKLPSGWSEDKIRSVTDHYEAQNEDEAINEDEAALAVQDTLMQVPVELVADIRALIAREQAKH